MDKRYFPTLQGQYTQVFETQGEKYGKTALKRSFPIKNRVSIDERPNKGFAESVGDWEMDTIVGKGGKGTIVIGRQIQFVTSDEKT